MLRMSWLILETARPRSASRFCSASIFWRRSCICDSSRSATPISSARAAGSMMRAGSSGASEKASMERVMVRTGPIMMRSMAT